MQPPALPNLEEVLLLGPASSGPPAENKRGVRRRSVRPSVPVPERALARAIGALARYERLLREAIQRNFNEADTRVIINDMLGELWGFDKFLDVTSELRIRNQFADYGVRIDGKVAFLIEAKAVTVRLSEDHLFQVTSYAANEGIEWAILTNGREWRLYHLLFGKPIERVLVLQVDLLDEARTRRTKAETAVYLSRESFQRGLTEALWRKTLAVSPKNVEQTLMSECVMSEIRRELRRRTGYRATKHEVREMLDVMLARAT